MKLGVGTEQSTALELPLWSLSEFGAAESDVEQRQEFVKSAPGDPSRRRLYRQAYVTGPLPLRKWTRSSADYTCRYMGAFDITLAQYKLNGLPAKVHRCR
jgi:hypothetical protein